MKHVSVTEAHELQQQGARTWMCDRGRVRADIRTARSTSRCSSREEPARCAQPGLRARDAGELRARREAAHRLPGRRPIHARRADARAFGFTDVSNVNGGFGGARDPMSGRSSIPAGRIRLASRDRRSPPGRRYDDLAAKAGADEVITRRFHVWERRLASVDTNRIVRPFEWGLDWLGLRSPGRRSAARLSRGRASAVGDSDAFFAARRPPTIELRRRRLRFPSAVTTPYAGEQHRRRAASFPRQHARQGGARRAPSSCCRSGTPTPSGHVGLCRLLARFGITAVRLEPAVSRRAPAARSRARRLHRQLEHRPDARRPIGRPCSTRDAPSIGSRRRATSASACSAPASGSCLAMLTMAHDPRIRAGAFNHISPYFADVVWRGLSTRHVRAGIEGH